MAILDYGCGNLGSVVNAFRHIGAECYITRTMAHPYTHIVLPGQGAYRDIGGWRQLLNDWHAAGAPILGICLGMQLMCESSEEAPGVKGLGWIPAKCEKLPVSRLPHVGWNTVPPIGDFYFCHSYGVLMESFFAIRSAGPDFDAHWVNATDNPLIRFLGAAFNGNLWAVQFHPEKSGKAGLDLLREFLSL